MASLGGEPLELLLLRAHLRRLTGSQLVEARRSLGELTTNGRMLFLQTCNFVFEDRVLGGALSARLLRDLAVLRHPPNESATTVGDGL